ncbi:lipoprotein-releasing ABC transporter permease subunit LolE [Catenovulum sp. 2E275]|uniref:lipoprotein-releasing ABC transporter permease subunit LolE n=1 Tax=Catenovulum sp. 2E275 TaxID=2980497 RepID=UPI0021D1C957|nr:lipoprotein-releasing ABC transporter permease subunit LolE [Catenovulum sp. 2E275]MCU4675346.1 lipoprotein-releasing ABC transporter permease subunit LolE [Catenovulum sp. 2E275]
MINSLAAKIGIRYAKSQAHNRFIRFISASSTSGIALGVCVLIWVLSAMNGFENELKTRLLSIVPHIEFSSVEASGIENWQSVAAGIKQHQQVLGVAPFVRFSGLIQYKDELKPVEIRGIDWQAEQAVADLKSYIMPEYINNFKQQEGVILGKDLAKSLKLSIGDSVQVLVPQVDENKRLLPPKSLSLTLIGLLESGGQLDHTIGFTQLPVAAAATGWTRGVQGLRIKIDDVFNAGKIAREIGYTLPVYVYVQDWTRQFGHVYNDIQLVRSIMYIILALVIAVACFNIVSTLVMAVNEKQSDIAILRTMGMKKQHIVQSFMLQGLYHGLLGTSIGVVLGILGGLYLGKFIALLESLFGFHLLSGDIYFIDFLPTKLNWHDVWITASVAIVMSLIATIYPSLKAAKVDPAKVVGKI